MFQAKKKSRPTRLAPGLGLQVERLCSGAPAAELSLDVCDLKEPAAIGPFPNVAVHPKPTRGGLSMKTSIFYAEAMHAYELGILL